MAPHGKNSSQPAVELLWWEGCPSWERALEMLREEMRAVGLDPATVEVREVRTEQDAAEQEFVGSPTIRVNGEDLQPVPEAPAGLTCRIYRLRDGRISPLPDREELRETLEMAMQASAGRDEPRETPTTSDRGGDE
jgi:hypothetical protein